jgi:hypothetical protein
VVPKRHENAPETLPGADSAGDANRPVADCRCGVTDLEACPAVLTSAIGTCPSSGIKYQSSSRAYSSSVRFQLAIDGLYAFETRASQFTTRRIFADRACAAQPDQSCDCGGEH